MDLISHGLWAGIGYKASHKDGGKKRNLFLFVFWSIFPDIFSFALLFIWFALVIVSNGFDFSILPHHLHSVDANEPPALFGFTPIFQLTSALYSLSHSLIVFFFTFALTFLIMKKAPWTMLGWLLHILIDIPTHSYQFYPAPVLWPLSGWKFYGITWGTPWFLILNYSAIVFVYLFFLRKKKSPHSG